MANETAQQGTESVIAVTCDPSLKVGFLEALSAAGFKHQTDAVITLVRDLIAGRIQYKDGILQSQDKLPNLT